MNAIKMDVLQQEGLFDFLVTSIGSNELKVFQLAGDASNRRYFRVIQGEKTHVLMKWEAFMDDSNYPFLSVLNHFHRNGVHVPKVYAKAPELGLILLEDLGDLTLERKFWESQDQNFVVPFYKMAIDELVHIHYAATKDTSSPCTAFATEFDTKKFIWELNYARTHLLEGILKQIFSAAEEQVLKESFHFISSTLDKEPKFISHRDYHSRNLMIKLDKMKVIDFQDARLGPIQYDLVSLFKDSYVNLSEDITDILFNYYFDRRRDFVKQPISNDHFYSIYELQSVQRCFKACGSFASFFNSREDTRYLKYITSTLNRVNKSLNIFPELSEFQRILENSGALETEYTTCKQDP